MRNTKQPGPRLPVSEELHAMKYRSRGETFEEAMTRIAQALEDTHDHFRAFRHILLGQRFLPAGRIQSSMGSPRKTTAFNCFVSDTIKDSMKGIMKAAEDAAMTMRMGGGIGYDFSTLRPRGDTITTLDSPASGPVSFMEIFDAVCSTVSSAGQRRGAQMAVLRVDHPDIEEFIDAKTNVDRLTNFNVSVGVTDEFMQAVRGGHNFFLRWEGRVYKEVSARALWDKIMRATWDWAEPGVLFLDRINQANSLAYCETIAATNPCSEQPLPPNGACLLGSFNLVRYIEPKLGEIGKDDRDYFCFDWRQFIADIPHVVRAMDNVIDRTDYPLSAQELEAQKKRRIGIGVTGLANAGEALGYSYGSKGFLGFTDKVLRVLANECYRESAYLAAEKGPFPLYDKGEYSNAPFINKLDADVMDAIAEVGLRNSHLISIAPTGTISLTADNVSSGIEPVFSESYKRTIRTDDGSKVETVQDYGVRVFGTKPRTTSQCSVQDHLDVLRIASWWSDSAVSKTLNVGPEVTWDEFKDIYMKVWEFGGKGCTTFRANGKRSGILQADEPKEISEGSACYVDPETGVKECS